MTGTLTDNLIRLEQRIRGGVIPAMATPLTEDGHLNVGALRSLVDFLVKAGVRGLFIGGTTGEGILLPIEERLHLHARAMEIVDGRIPALIHVGTNDTATAVRLAQHAREIKADAVVAVTPFFYPMHDEAMYTFYHSLADAAPETPLFAYDIPQMAINSISPALLIKLKELPTFAGLKSSHPDAQHIRKLVDTAAREVVILAGNERIALGSLALGVDGLISGLSTAVPEPFVALLEAFRTGNMEEARHQQRIINRILDHLPPGARIGGIKKILSERGIDAGPPLPPRPMPVATWSGWSRIEQLIQHF